MTVSTAAGNGLAGYVDGDAGSAQFNWPNDIVFGPDGTAYIADFNNNVIRRLSVDGQVTTYAGSGVPGFANGPARSAQFNNPAYLTIDSNGNLFVVDWSNHSIREVAADGTVSTLAGDGIQGDSDGLGPAARFSHPAGITVDSSGLVYVADAENNRIVTITQSGMATTLSGGVSGFTDGALSTATFNYPCDVRFDRSGALYVSDRNNCAVRVISSSGVVTTLVGRAGCGFRDGSASQAQLNWPIGISPAANGLVYVVDDLNQRIRVIDSLGNTTTLAGTGSAGYVDGPAASAQFHVPIDMSPDPSGNLYVADRLNNVIRKVTFGP